MAAVLTLATDTRQRQQLKLAMQNAEQCVHLHLSFCYCVKSALRRHHAVSSPWKFLHTMPSISCARFVDARSALRLNQNSS